MWLISITVVVWVTCGILAYGFCLGYFDGEFPQFSYKNRRMRYSLALMLGVMGPMGLLVNVIASESFTHGLRWKTLSREESMAAYKARYPSLPYDA